MKNFPQSLISLIHCPETSASNKTKKAIQNKLLMDFHIDWNGCKENYIMELSELNISNA